MKTRPQWRTAAILLAVTVLASCSAATGASGPRTVQPGAPGESSRPVTTSETAGTVQPRHTEDDVRFMQGMIVHHRQALEMTSLVPERTNREDIRLLARRIEISQEDEMALMRRWLRDRGEEVPGADAHYGHHGAGGHQPLMPGMITEQEMARLATATGAEFDRLFLEFMIRHHEGALVMVENLFASDNAGQEGEIFQFAAHVAGDQRVEIERMRRMLAAIQ